MRPPLSAPRQGDCPKLVKAPYHHTGLSTGPLGSAGSSQKGWPEAGRDTLGIAAEHTRTGSAIRLGSA